jgi:hypothetical protein
MVDSRMWITFKSEDGQELKLDEYTVNMHPDLYKQVVDHRELFGFPEPEQTAAFYTISNGEIESRAIYDKASESDVRIHMSGLLFNTIDSAWKFLKLIRAYRHLYEYAHMVNGDWSPSATEGKYRLAYDLYEKQWSTTLINAMSGPLSVHFRREEDAQFYIDNYQGYLNDTII